MNDSMDSIKQDVLDKIQNICILCWGRIGDVFFRIPLIEAVKKQFPNSKIFIVVDPCGYEILMNHPDVDEIVIVDRTKKPRLKYIREIYSKSQQLRKANLDLCINLYSGGSSAAFSRIINAKIRLGFDHTKALCRFNTVLVKSPRFCQHWTYCLATVLQPLGIEASHVRLGSSFHVTRKSLENSNSILSKDKNYVVFNLGTGAIDKNWPVLSYVALANKIFSEFNIIALVLTNPDMPDLAKEFHERCENSVLLPALSFDEIAGLLVKVGMLITGDTSIMHLAFAVKVPNLVMFTKTRPEIVTPDDCIHQACFIEDKNCINECGNYEGTIDIPLDYAFEQYKKVKLRADDE